MPEPMWGTDGVRVFTVDDGWGWIFTAVEHWNAECVGWHVCKRGDRFAALQPISMGLAGLMAGSTPRWPCGWNATSTNRSSSVRRTLKEQIIHGRIYRHAELRDAVRASNSTISGSSKRTAT